MDSVPGPEMTANPLFGISRMVRRETLNTFYFKGPIYLKGERIISSMDIWIPKYLVPILAARKKKSVTNMIEMKINIQDVRSNSFSKLKIGATLAGYLENQ